MNAILDTRHDLTCYAVTAVDDIAWPGIMAMVDAAWQADAQEQTYMVLDAPLMSRLLSASTWLAGVVCTSTGAPVGFALLVERLLYWHQQPWRAYYLSFLTVAAQHRRRGLGQWLLHCLQHHLFQAHGADFIVAAFDPARAGLPTVQKTVAHCSGRAFKPFHTAPLWGMRLKMPSRPPGAVAWEATQVALPMGATALSPMGDERQASTPRLPSVTSVTAALRTQYGVAFGLETSIRARYFRPDTPGAGTWWYACRNAQEHYCGLSFELVTVRPPTGHLGMVGIIQAVYATDCHPTMLSQAVQHLCGTLQQAGGAFVVLLDHGGISHTVLRQLGFAPTGGTRVFAVWGPRATIEPLPAVEPPHLLDW